MKREGAEGFSQSTPGAAECTGQTLNQWMVTLQSERPAERWLFVCSVHPAALGVLGDIAVLCALARSRTSVDRAEHGGETRGRRGVLTEHTGGRRVHRANPKSMDGHVATDGVVVVCLLGEPGGPRCARRHCGALRSRPFPHLGRPCRTRRRNERAPRGSHRAHRGPPSAQGKPQINRWSRFPPTGLLLFVCSVNPAALRVLGESAVLCAVSPFRPHKSGLRNVRQ